MTAAIAVHGTTDLQPLETLYEERGLPRFDLPDDLASAYGGLLGLSTPSLYANFVASFDGVVAIPGEPYSSRLISAASQADRFVMGLLRACADAVLVGAGTLLGSPQTHWTPEHAYRPASEMYAELRRLRGRPPQPTLAVLSGAGTIDPEHPGLTEDSVVLTSERGLSRLRGRVPRSATIIAIGDTPKLDLAAAVEALRAGGHELILCEGGPMLFGSLVEAGLVDELFLTISPLLAGRGARSRPGLIEGVEFLPGRTVPGRLLSLRRSRSHLFVRYAIEASVVPR